MGRACTLIAVLFLTPSIANAQPAQDSTAKDDSVPQTESVPPQAGSEVPQVVPPEKPVTSAETETDAETETGAETDKRGLTVEASVGVSVLFENSSPYVNDDTDTYPGLAFALGAGYFVSSRVALGLRVTGFYLPGVHVGFVGPHAQFWLSPSVWLGTGVGVGLLVSDRLDRVHPGFPSFDARLGSVLGRGFNISLELARLGALGPYGDGYEFGEPSYLVNVMLGYQRL